ncbi:hypothetical protein EYC84_005407 [Monilinia fructicola]|uniref:Uncharacterized protein n=1 Tax=Monilinia fructicola TaxID=38448 RepID=A0A5M9JWC9_MONFR|nr:hypothetical protein EYC84_005407 [Monilinia fructicola]
MSQDSTSPDSSISAPYHVCIDRRMRLDDYMNAVAAEAAQDEWNEQQSEYIEELEHRIQELEQMIDLQQRDSRVFARS